MVSDKYKCIFIHIPKTAGTSIEKALEHFKELDRGVQDHRTIRDIIPVSTNDLIFSIINREFNVFYIKFKKFIKDYKENYHIKYDTYFKFSFVRNPWARVFSWYNNVMRDDNHKKRFDVNHDCTFKYFIKNHMNQWELKPQLYWLMDKHGNIPLEFIGKFENLENDFKIVADRLNLDCPKLPKLLISNVHNYTDYYDNDMIDAIYKTYIDEIKIFEYEFGS